MQPFHLLPFTISHHHYTNLFKYTLTIPLLHLVFPEQIQTLTLPFRSSSSTCRHFNPVSSESHPFSYLFSYFATMVRTKHVCYKKTTPVVKPDAPIFISREAEARFKALSSDKTLILERGFDSDLLTQGAYPEYVQQVIRIKTTTGSLWFPDLITELCRNSGVKIKGTEERLKLSAPITLATIQRMTGSPASASKPKKEPSTSVPGPSSAPAPATGRVNVSQPLFDLQQQFATLVLQQEVVWRYMAERDIALAANLMANSPKFTPFPSFPQSVFEMAGTADEPIPHDASGSRKRKRGKGVIEDSEPEQDTKEDDGSSTS